METHVFGLTLPQNNYAVLAVCHWPTRYDLLVCVCLWLVPSTPLDFRIDELVPLCTVDPMCGLFLDTTHARSDWSRSIGLRYTAAS